MCIAIYQEEGKGISRKQFENSFVNNPDGAGFAWIDGDTLRTEKGFFDMDEAWTFYRETVRGRQALLHFRIATGGTIAPATCHPFRVTSELVFVHNGTIPIEAGMYFQDTAFFNRFVLRRMEANQGPFFLDRPENDWLLSEAIGNSKLVFLHASGRYWIVNETRGEWIKGCWFSNNSHKNSLWKGPTKKPKAKKTKSKKAKVYESELDRRWEAEQERYIRELDRESQLDAIELAAKYGTEFNESDWYYSDDDFDEIIETGNRFFRSDS